MSDQVQLPIKVPEISLEVPEVSPKKTQAQAERALLRRKPAWRAGYEYLMTTKPGARYYDVLLAVWLSCTKSDRGDLATQERFADFIGVSRAVTYQWLDRRPEIKEWARELVELRFDASTIGEVDTRLIQKAKSTDSTPQWVRLFYQRAQVLKEELDLHHMGAEDGPIEIRRADELSDDELAAIAARSGAGTTQPTASA